MNANTKVADLTLESILCLSKDVVVRNDINGKLLFQIPTDEMYFLEEATYDLVNMLDGSQTVGDVIKNLATINDQFSSKEAELRVFSFLQQLIDRQLIDVWD